MNTVSLYLDRKKQLWPALGPFMLLLTLGVIFLKSSSYQAYYFTLGVLGLLAAWQWNVKGMYAAIAATFVLYLSLAFTSQFSLWHAGATFSLSLCFVISALCYEEDLAALSTSQAEPIESSQPPQESFQFSLEKEELLKKLKVLEDNLFRRNEEVEHFRKKFSQQESSYDKQCLALKEAVAAKEREISNLQIELGRVDTSQVARLQEQIKALEIQREEQKLDILNFQAQLKVSIDELQQSRQLKQQLEQRFEAILKEKQEHLDALYQAQNDHLLQKRLNDELNELLSTAQMENLLLEKTLTQLQTELEDTQGQVNCFKEQSQKEQQSICQLEHTCSAYTYQLQELNVRLQALQSQAVEAERVYQREKAILIKDIEALKQQALERKTEVIYAPAENLAAAMYQQLRQQFSEKSQVLDQTRKELFICQEKLQAIELDQIEKQRNLSGFEQELYDQIVRLSKELEDAQEENEFLTNLVDQQCGQELIYS